jgi:hypothetical protein
MKKKGGIREERKDGALTRSQKLTLRENALSSLDNAKSLEETYKEAVKEGTCRITKVYDKNLRMTKISYTMLNSDKIE